MSITIDDIHVVYRSSKRVTQKQLDKLKTEFGAELPLGYRRLVMTLGHGWINDWLQIYRPDAELLAEQRNSLIQRFTNSPPLDCKGAKLKLADITTSVQIGIDQDTTQIFACKRFPGSVFEWSDFTITRHKRGLERLDGIAGMQMERFAYFLPLSPIPEHRSLACQSKKLPVEDVVQALQDQCRGDSHVVDVDEGPEPGSRTPAFWVFPKKLGVMLHVYAVETNRTRRVVLTLGTSPKLLPKVEALINSAAETLGVRFKPAQWY